MAKKARKTTASNRTTAPGVEREITNIRTLVPWLRQELEEQREENRKLAEALAKRMKRIEKAFPAEQLSPVPNEDLVALLTRALLLSGDGSRFDPTVREIILRFRRARDEVRRIQAVPGITDTDRKDLCCGQTLVAEEHRAELRLLGVVIEQIPVGSQLDRCHSNVVGELPCDETERVGTVAECVQPLFTWTNAFGEQSREFADVVVYSAARPNRTECSEAIQRLFDELDAQASESCGNVKTAEVF